MQYTISARDKKARQSIQQFLKEHFSEIPLDEIDSFFGFTTYSSLYGGRVWDVRKLNPSELSEYDLRSMYKWVSTCACL